MRRCAAAAFALHLSAWAALPTLGAGALTRGASAANSRPSTRRPASLSTAALAQANTDRCPIVTGHHCWIFDCDQSLGGSSRVECLSGHCLCRNGFCSVHGKCEQEPKNSAISDAYHRATAPIYWTRYPEKCVHASADWVRLLECGSAPDKFVLPVGGTGQIKWLGNASLCLGVPSVYDGGFDSTTWDQMDKNGLAVKLLACDEANPYTHFVLPNGATGMVHWEPQPNKCLSVRAGDIWSGDSLELWDCEDDNLNETFSMSDEAPPPFLPCQSVEECASMRRTRIKDYCTVHPDWPMCELMRKCPPGGCNNGECFNGYCVCNTGLQGTICDQPVGGPVPIGAYYGEHGQDMQIIRFAPSPALGPSPAAPPSPYPGAAPSPAPGHQAAPSPFPGEHPGPSPGPPHPSSAPAPGHMASPAPGYMHAPGPSAGFMMPPAPALVVPHPPSPAPP